MMFKAAIFATILALAASQQAVQQYIQNPYYNVPGNLEFPQGQQNYYNGQYQGPIVYDQFNLNNLFKQYPFISLVNNQNQPLGYIYWVNSDYVLQQQQNYLPVRDSYGNLLGYYTLKQYTPGQQFQPQILNENLISQLGQFGFVYNQPGQEKLGFLVVKNPYVFYNNENGVLRPTSFQNNFNFKPQFPYNFIRPNYNGQYQYPPQYYYGQQYQGFYLPRFQGQYNQIYQFPYNYNYNQYVPTY
ncbi:uncharacterized protein [Halyomorpha halys]|uniref:uncharacterized protein n=1 Tax=Halyomorpha halys TaxID=286706 RepID=UPI0006D4F978|nr:uncharacterized protein LOC106689962 [Halyomorpha halys]